MWYEGSLGAAAKDMRQGATYGDKLPEIVTFGELGLDSGAALVIAPADATLQISPSASYTAQGLVARSWAPLPTAAGVAVTQLPGAPSGMTAMLRARTASGETTLTAEALVQMSIGSDLPASVTVAATTHTRGLLPADDVVDMAIEDVLRDGALDRHRRPFESRGGNRRRRPIPAHNRAAPRRWNPGLRHLPRRTKNRPASSRPGRRRREPAVRLLDHRRPPGARHHNPAGNRPGTPHEPNSSSAARCAPSTSIPPVRQSPPYHSTPRQRSAPTTRTATSSAKPPSNPPKPPTAQACPANPPPPASCPRQRHG